MKINQVSKLYITTYLNDIALYRMIPNKLFPKKFSITEKTKDRFYDRCCRTRLRMINEKESNSFYKCNQ